jgi:uncharacterized repeat protein (TIGR01451 family)
MQRIVLLALAAAVFPLAAGAHSIVDMSVRTAAPAFAVAGSRITYSVTVSDLAYDLAYGIVLTDQLPSGTTFVSASGGDAWNCSASNGTVTCAAESLNPGDSVVTIVATAPSQAGPAVNTATVDGLGIIDPNAANNTAVTRTTMYIPSACTMPSPLLLAPSDGATLDDGAAHLAWSESAGASRYRIWTAVEGARPYVLGETAATRFDAAAEAGAAEWWVEASSDVCPPVPSAHAHFVSHGRPFRLYVSDFAGKPGVAGHDDGAPDQVTFDRPASLGVDDSGRLLVVDSAASTLRSVATDGSATVIAGQPDATGSLDGPGTYTRMNHPRGIAVAVGGYAYIADTENETVRQFFPNGNGYYFGAILTTIAGSAGATGSSDGVGTNARFNGLAGIAVTRSSTIFIADTANHCIRKTDPLTSNVVTVAGSAGNAGSADGKGSAARFNSPAGLAVDDAGNVFVADSGNHTIRKIAPDGTVTTVAGFAGLSGLVDGVGASARFDTPAGLAFDALGNLYVADSGSHNVRRIAPSGFVTTVAGGAPGHANGDGAAARFNAPAAVAIDAAGRLFIADRDNHVIRLAMPVPQGATQRRRAAGR